jgi:hypothetical protein
VACCDKHAKLLVLLLVVQASKSMAMHSLVQPPRLSQWGWVRATTPMHWGGGRCVGKNFMEGGPMPLGQWVSQLTGKG